MAFTLISDVHLDLIVQPDSVISEIAKAGTGGVLVLAGDIASPHTERGRTCWNKLVEECGQTYSHMVMVMGNHEHYDGDLTKTKELLPREVLVLDRDIWTHPEQGYTIAGCTLWSQIPKHLQARAIYQLNDFSSIGFKGRGFTPAIYNVLNERDVAWLEKFLDGAVGPKVVVTHHAPLLNGGCSAEKYMRKDTNFFFENQLQRLVRKADVWCCGHTHHRADFIHEGCRVVLNCLGYANEHVGLEVKEITIPGGRE